jgi:hypothetical protein
MQRLALRRAEGLEGLSRLSKLGIQEAGSLTGASRTGAT